MSFHVQIKVEGAWCDVYGEYVPYAPPTWTEPAEGEFYIEQVCVDGQRDEYFENLVIAEFEDEVFKQVEQGDEY